MKVEETELSGIKLVTPKYFPDNRGYFFEAFNQKIYEQNNIRIDFIQDNISFSKKNVLRGLHLQKTKYNQAKFVYCPHGEIYDVVVDLREDSKTFGKWKAFILSSENKNQLYIPAGFAHGFCVLSEEAIVSYKTTSYYLPEAEITLRWNDPNIGVDWPVNDPVLSERDNIGQSFKEIIW